MPPYPFGKPVHPCLQEGPAAFANVSRWVDKTLLDLQKCLRLAEGRHIKVGKNIAKVLLRHGRSDKVNANLALNLSQHGIPTKRAYIYNGIFSSTKLAMYYRDKEAPNEYLGALVMQLNPEKQLLRGKSLYYCHKENKVVYTQATFKRGNIAANHKLHSDPANNAVPMS